MSEPLPKFLFEGEDPDDACPDTLGCDNVDYCCGNTIRALRARGAKLEAALREIATRGMPGCDAQYVAQEALGLPTD